MRSYVKTEFSVVVSIGKGTDPGNFRLLESGYTAVVCGKIGDLVRLSTLV